MTVVQPEERDGVHVVIPAYNERAAIREAVQGVLALGVHVVVVDDCSTDGSIQQVVDLPITILRHSVNLGQGAALQTGIEHAVARGARIVATFDADGQHDPADVPLLLAALAKEGADVAVGSRFLGRAVDMPRARRLLLRAAVAYTRWTTGLQVTDTHNGLRAFRAECAPALTLTQNRMAHASEFLERVRAAGLRHVEVPSTVRYSEYSRAKGQTGLGAVDVLYELTIRRLLR